MDDLSLPGPGNSASAAARTPADVAKPSAQRIALVLWLRKTHGWIGLWGAVLGLTFGISGIWLNHRAVLKLPPVAQQRESIEISLPIPAPENAEAMLVWLRGSLHLADGAGTVRVEKAKAVPWAEKNADAKATAPLMQPEHWTFNFATPDVIIQAEYWMGNQSVGVRTTRNGFMATLMNFHKGVGMTTAWILLVDTLAGSLILLSLTGLLLWLLTHRKKVVGVAITVLSLLAALGIITVSMQV